MSVTRSFFLLTILHFLASSLFLYVNAFPRKRNFFQLQPHERFADFYSSFFFKLLDIFFLCIDQSDFLWIVLFTEEAGFTRNGVFNSYDTHIHQYKSGKIQQVLQEFGILYIEKHRRVLEISTYEYVTV